jgi:hypothetical protein
MMRMRLSRRRRLGAEEELVGVDEDAECAALEVVQEF